MKQLLYVLLGVLVVQPSYGNPNSMGIPESGQAYAYTAVGRNTAAVYWSSKGCISGLSSLIATVDGSVANEVQCINQPNPDLYAPTVVIFNGKTGDIVKHIKFFDESCAYIPVSLTANRGRTVTMAVHVHMRNDLTLVGSGVGSDILSFMDNENYPDCPYTNGESVTLTETRSVRTGKLIYKAPLQDIGTYDFN